MTVPEVSQLLQIDVSTAYRKCRNGSLPAFGLDGVVRVDPAELANHLEAKTRLGIRKKKPTVQ